MNSLEQMMQAIYDMVRSLLNMRNSQLRSNVTAWSLHLIWGGTEFPKSVFDKFID